LANDNTDPTTPARPGRSSNNDPAPSHQLFFDDK